MQGASLDALFFNGLGYRTIAESLPTEVARDILPFSRFKALLFLIEFVLDPFAPSI